MRIFSSPCAEGKLSKRFYLLFFVFLGNSKCSGINERSPTHGLVVRFLNITLNILQKKFAKKPALDRLLRRPQ